MVFPGLNEQLVFFIVEFLPEILLEILSKFGDSLVFDHNLLVVAPALGGGPVAQIIRQYFENLFGSEFK